MPTDPPRFTTTLSPSTGTVALQCSIGLLTCTSTIPVSVYERRQEEWPDLYPSDAELIVKKA